MKTKSFLCLIALSLSSFSFAESTATISEQLKPFNNVRVSIQRMLRSADNRYFLDLYAGIWNPHGTLKDLTENKSIAFKGIQRGNLLNLKSVSVDSSDETVTQYTLDGNLNANTGELSAVLSTIDGSLKNKIDFEPAFKVVDKPIIVFKFYGNEDTQQASGKVLKRVDIINKTDNTILQSLTGFNAFSNSIGFLDINFDGYYDVVLSDLSEGKKVEDKHFIYWMYNPKTKQFQRSPQLEEITGFPTLHGENQQIDFGYGQLYQVEKGLLSRIQ